jgi:serine/threonine-protein kinase
VLEYVEGETIDRWCDARALDVKARVRLFIDVLDAVAHAHNNLTLHRDLKPSNILVDTDGRVKLLDFGVAKLIDDPTRPAAPTELTQLAGRAFTPDFAAPEQVLGGDVSTATDVYALGVLLYLVLSGRHPNEGAPPAERLRALLEDEPRRLPEVARQAPAEVVRARSNTTAGLVRDLRGDLDNIVAKALKKSTAERYQSAAALAEDLRRYLADQPVEARPDSLVYRMGKFLRRYRVAVGAAAAVILALAAGIVGTTWQSIEASRQREAAQFEARVARANHEFVSQLFGDAMRGGESSEMRARLDRARELLRRRYADDPVVHSTLLFQLAGRYAELQDATREAEVMGEVESLAARAGEPSLSATLECIKAYDLIERGDAQAARGHVAEGLRLMGTSHRMLTVAGFECYRAEAMLATATGDHRRGVERMERWLSQLERDGLGKTRLYLSSLGSLAHLHRMADDLQAGLAVSRRARALNEALGSETTLAGQIDLGREAALLYQLGRISDALEADRQLVRRFAGMEAGRDVPISFIPNLSARAIVGGSPQQAVAWLRSAIPSYERAGSERNVRGATLDLADAYLHLRQYGEARAELRRFEAWLAQAAARPRERVEAARLNVELALGEQAVEALGPALAELDDALAAVDGVPRISRVLGHFAAVRGRLQQGETTAARAHAERALQLAGAKTIDGQASAWVGAARLLLARTVLADGGRAGAREQLDRARAELADTLPEGHAWRGEADATIAAL